MIIIYNKKNFYEEADAQDRREDVEGWDNPAKLVPDGEGQAWHGRD